MRLLTCALALCAPLTFHASAGAVPTELTVRVIAKDGLFVGTMAGGVRITVKDAESGELLAQGIAEGSVGNIGRILKTDRRRGVRLSDADSARFTTVLDLTEPRRVVVEAFGPLAYPASANTVSASQWLVPGKSVSDGDGWVLEMPGFFVEIDTPLQDEALAKGTVDLSVHVTMMCGCPVMPGGLWDADHYEMAVMLQRDGTLVGEEPLEYAGKQSQFKATLALEAGSYEAIVYAYDAANGNTGVDRVSFTITE